MKKYHVITTPKFDRIAKKFTKRSPEIRNIVEKTINILAIDPYNLTKTHNIGKLKDTHEDGIYRLRLGWLSNSV